MRTVEWNFDTQRLQMIDQRLLPSELKIITYEDHQQVADAIRNMVVRGAPAIGAAAAFGLALAAQNSPAKSVEDLRSDLEQAAEILKMARPTAANLNWALNRVLRSTSQVEHSAGLREAVLVEAQLIADQDVEINQKMATRSFTTATPGRWPP